MSKVYVISARRTPIGSFLGSLSKVHPADLGSVVVKNILEETKVPKDAVYCPLCGRPSLLLHNLTELILDSL